MFDRIHIDDRYSKVIQIIAVNMIKCCFIQKKRCVF